MVKMIKNTDFMKKIQIFLKFLLGPPGAPWGPLGLPGASRGPLGTPKKPKKPKKT